jgi:hypothetical protein
MIGLRNEKEMAYAGWTNLFTITHEDFNVSRNKRLEIDNKKKGL